MKRTIATLVVALTLLTTGTVFAFPSGDKAKDHAGDHTITWTGQGVTGGVLNTSECPSKDTLPAGIDPNSYLHWIMTTDGGSATAASLTLGGTGTGTYTGAASGGAFHFFTPYYTPDGSLTATATFTFGLDGDGNPDTGNGAWILTISHGCAGLVEDEDAKLNVIKFYDANANGINDDSQPISGWKININGDVFYTPYSETVEPGGYTVSEYLPIETNWMATTASPVNVTLAAGEEKTVEFGNLCLGAGGGHTLGFWSNRNGQALIDASDLQALRDLSLRNANGTNFEPTTAAQVKSWLLSANATNMAYMLSAQLAAMKLNALNGFVNGTSLVYAPGATGANSLGFITINALMAEANASLLANGDTVASGAVRTYQEALKNALDGANNNLNFVQSTPCAFSFAE